MSAPYTHPHICDGDHCDGDCNALPRSPSFIGEPETAPARSQDDIARKYWPWTVFADEWRTWASGWSASLELARAAVRLAEMERNRAQANH